MTKVLLVENYVVFIYRSKKQISTTTSVLSARDFRGDNVFMKTPNADQVGLSVEDRVTGYPGV